MTSSSPKSLRELAKAWAAAGLSIVPVRADGSKAPAVSTWTELQDRILTNDEIDTLFEPGLGIAIIGGEISGNLEFLDFDIPKDENGDVLGECAFDAWMDCLDIDLLEIVSTMPMVKTPGGGVHLYYRCPEIEGNRKLAMKKNPPGTVPPYSTVVETRGRGGYVLAPGCPPECHPSGKTYELISGSFGGGGGGGDDGVPTITPEQRTKLFGAARSFDESDLSAKEARRRDPSLQPADQRDGNRPGDDYNRRANWSDILEPEGWTLAFTRRRDGAECWRRPGKPEREKGISATIREFEGLQLFHSFSSNSNPLPHDESITKFTAYTLFHHDGDYKNAARALGKLGYGEPPRRIQDLDAAVDGKRPDDIPWSDEDPGGREAKVSISDISIRDEHEAEALPFEIGGPSEFDVSVFHSEMDPLEVQLFEDQEKLEVEQEDRLQKEKMERREVQMARGPAYIVWRDHGDEPVRSYTKNKQIKTRVDRPRDTAWHIINDKFSHKGEIRSLHYQHGEFMHWSNARYRRLKSDDVRPKISNYLTYFAEWDGEDEDGASKYVAYKVRKVRVEEMLTMVKDMSHIDAEILDPSWLCDTSEIDGLPDAREIVCCKNGLLDIANRQLIDSTPAFYSFNNTEIEYDPEAPRPNAWLNFLEDTLDAESRTLLQEWFGYCLVQDTRLQKMLMVVGKPGSGKGTAMEILQSLVGGTTSCCSMEFDKLENQFSMSMALGKSVMIFPDARQSYGSGAKGVVGTLLSVSGEDAVFIDRKNMNPVTQKLNCRIVIVSNDVISLSDPSGALNRRMLWIKFPGFAGQSDPNLKERLLGEISGILNWAVEGWHKVRSTGQFTQPESAQDFIDVFQEQASPIKKFLEDMCTVGEGEKSPIGDFFNHWNIWRSVNGYKGKQSQAAFGKQLLSADMSIKKTRLRVDGKRAYLYTGISLNKDKIEEFIADSVGQKQWDNAKDDEARRNDADVLSILDYISKKEKSDK